MVAFLYTFNSIISILFNFPVHYTYSYTTIGTFVLLWLVCVSLIMHLCMHLDSLHTMHNASWCIFLVQCHMLSLSMLHDSQGNSCLDEGGVMSASLGRGPQVYLWSNCSASELRAFRIGGGTKCLMETDPANSVIKPASPGQEFDLDYQCKAMFGDHATVCPWHNSAVSS